MDWWHDRRGPTSAALVVVLVITAACTASGVPTTTASAGGGAETSDRTPPPPMAPMAVALVRPAGFDPIPGQVVPLSVHVLAEEPIARLELWAGSELVDTASLDGGRATLSYVFEWSPPRPGLNALMARAIDIEGRVGQSTPVWIRAPDPALLPLPPPEARIPVVTVGVPASRLLASPIMAIPPAPPQVVVNPVDCTATVEVPAVQDASGVAIYAASFGGSSFNALALVEPTVTSVEVPLTGGPQMLVLDVYNETTSLLAPPVVVDPDCQENGWTGNISIDEGVLNTQSAADRAYLYLAMDGGPWVRVPETDQTFVDWNGAGFDFGLILPPLHGQSLEVEAWGRVGDQLIALGQGSFTLDSSAGESQQMSPSIETVLGAMSEGDLDWLKQIYNVSTQNTDETLTRFGELCAFVPAQVAGNFDDHCTLLTPPPMFRWQANVGDVTHGVWQVSLVPPPEGPVLAYPGLLAFGPVPGSAADFTIPMKAVLEGNGPQQILPSEDIGWKDLSSMALGGEPAGTATTVGGGETFASVGVPLGPVVSSSDSIADDVSIILPVPDPDTVYVRVVPMNGSQPLSGVSNNVVLKLDHVDSGSLPTPPPQAALEMTVEFSEPGIPNQKYAHCVRVIENPFGSANPAPNSLVSNFYKAFEPVTVGGTECAYYSDPDDDFWDHITSAIEAAVWLYDTYVDFLMMLKAELVSAVVEYSGCTELASEELCSAVVNTAANVGLAYLGIPPTLPKFEDLVEAAKGDLRDWLVEAAVQAGMDCGEELQAQCEEMAGDMIDMLLDEAETAVSNAAVQQAASGSYHLYLNPAIKVVPEPAGTMRPATFEVTLTRTTHQFAQLPTSCSFDAYVFGTRENFTWFSGALQKQQTGLVDGRIFSDGSTSVAIPQDLAAGETYGFTMVLDDLVHWYPPGASKVFIPGAQPQTWAFFQGGAIITSTIVSDCVNGQTAAWVQDGVGAVPSEIVAP